MPEVRLLISPPNSQKPQNQWPETDGFRKIDQDYFELFLPGAIALARISHTPPGFRGRAAGFFRGAQWSARRGWVTPSRPCFRPVDRVVSLIEDCLAGIFSDLRPVWTWTSGAPPRVALSVVLSDDGEDRFTPERPEAAPSIPPLPTGSGSCCSSAPRRAARSPSRPPRF